MVLEFFTDPVLRGPTIGTMLMCAGSAIVGVLVFLRKQSLIGETLSHAAFPGIIIAIFLIGSLYGDEQYLTSWNTFLTLVGAFITASLGVFLIHLLQSSLKVAYDAALCFILAAFFGVGLTLTSDIQFRFSSLYKQALSYFYGQAATMTDTHIWIYGILTAAILFTIYLFHKEFKIITFDQEFGKSIGLPVKSLNTLLFFLVVLAVIIGIRSVGAVLMSAMLIAPAIAARQWTNHLSIAYALAVFFGVMSAFFGNYFSVLLSTYFSNHYPGMRLTIPTGPCIVLIMTLICLVSLLFAPKRGVCTRIYQLIVFRNQCLRENLLKGIWKLHPQKSFLIQDLPFTQTISAFSMRLALFQLKRQKILQQLPNHRFQLTEKGEKQGKRIVRLHRLWEAYLVNYVGLGQELVHHSAEEMEHVITKEIEQNLSQLLQDPRVDPHQQPIPPSNDKDD